MIIEPSTSPLPQPGSLEGAANHGASWAVNSLRDSLNVSSRTSRARARMQKRDDLANEDLQHPSSALRLSDAKSIATEKEASRTLTSLWRCRW